MVENPLIPLSAEYSDGARISEQADAAYYQNKQAFDDPAKVVLKSVHGGCLERYDVGLEKRPFVFEGAMSGGQSQRLLFGKSP